MSAIESYQQEDAPQSANTLSEGIFALGVRIVGETLLAFDRVTPLNTEADRTNLAVSEPDDNLGYYVELNQA